MLEFVKCCPNQVRLSTLPMLDDENETGDALRIKQAIYDLHQNLDDIHLEITRKGVNERISLRSVCIRPKPLQRSSLNWNRYRYQAEKIQGGAIEITVTSLRTHDVRFRHIQAQYRPQDIYATDTFQSDLSSSQQSKLREFYDRCNPRPLHNLVQGGGPPLSIGTMQFHCTAEDLLFGLVETIYAMRNALLHGEIGPDAQVLKCYEPAYRIVMHFLACVR